MYRKYKNKKETEFNSDVDFANDVNDRKSITGYIEKKFVWECRQLGNSKEKSSTKAQYIALSETSREAVWLKVWLKVCLMR